MRTSREVKLTAAGQALLEEAPLALAALERAAERTRLAGEGITGTVRLGYAPLASFETLGAILAAVENDNPNMTVIPSELFSAEIPGRVLAGELDIGLALHPEPMTGIRTRSPARRAARRAARQTPPPCPRELHPARRPRARDPPSVPSRARSGLLRPHHEDMRAGGLPA